MISAQLTKDGNLWVGLQQLKVPTESQDIQGLGSVSIAGLPTGSDLAVIEATGVMNPLSGANTIQDKVSTSGVAGSKLSPILLVSGAGLFAFIILGCVVILMVRRPRSKGGHSVDNRGRRWNIKQPISQSQHLFVVRIWQEPGRAPSTQWHGSVEHIPSGQRIYFTAMRDLNDFISLRLGSLSTPQNEK